MKLHYYLISFTSFRKLQMIVQESCEYDAKDAAYNILYSTGHGRIARITDVKQLMRRPHAKHLEPIKGASTNGKTWAWMYFQETTQ